MIVPSIVIPTNISEEILYFPSSVCGLPIGELYIPEIQVAIINIPEITVPDFGECPFSVVLPLPIYYASSPYPIHYSESINIGLDISEIHFERLPQNFDIYPTDGISLNVKLLSVSIRERVFYVADESLDTLKLTFSVVSGSIRPTPRISNNPENIKLTADVVEGKATVYRYLSWHQPPLDSITISSDVVGGSIVGFRWFSAEAGIDKIKISSDVVSGNSVSYRYLLVDDYIKDNLLLDLTVVSGVLKDE